MFMQIITCEQCGAGDLCLDIDVSFDHKTCPNCQHMKEDKQRHFFCKTACLLKYLKKNKGFVCHSCMGSKVAFQVPSNGQCKVCSGTGVRKI